MKKGGIIAAIIFISIFISIYIGIELIKGGLPEPEFGDLYNFEFDNTSSNEKETHIIAKLDISNPEKDKFNININYNNLSCTVFYNSQYIGHLKLSNTYEDSGILYQVSKRQETARSYSWMIPNIGPKENRTLSVLINISNDNLSKVFYNHTMENDERGKISFKLNFTLDINLPFGFTIPVEKNIIFDVEKDIETDFLEKLDWMKYQCNLSESYVNYPKENLSAISLEKKGDSNVIQLSFMTRFFRKITPLLDLYIGDNCYWITNTEPGNILIGQEVIFYSVPRRLFYLNFILPLGCRFYANDVPIGYCNILPVERDYRLVKSKRIEIPISLNVDQFGKWIYSHIKKNENTTVNVSFQNEIISKFSMFYPFDINQLFPLYGKNSTLFYFNTTLSEVIDEIELPDMSFDLNEIQRDLFFYQLLTIVLIINTIIVVIVLYFAFWKRGKYLVFK